MNQRQLFQQHIAQTSANPIGLQMVKAEGIYQYDVNGKRYVDFISGFSVCNIGHSHPNVVQAVQQQAAAYMHLIVYGEFIQQPQVEYAKLLVSHLPASLDNVYFTNSGTEATEGALKLAKRFTGRHKIIAFNNSYHGSTQGALSVMGNEYWRNAFRPLLPGIYHYDYNSDEVFPNINEETACVIVEAVQAESGVISAKNEWLQKLQMTCIKHGALFIIDEIQSGFGRTGSLWAFQQFNVVPDILLSGKALGGGMPLGAFIAGKNIMSCLMENPVLGHITTFGGHPVSCAAGKAAFNVLLHEKLINNVACKEAILKQYLKHPKIKSLHTKGLWGAVEFDSFETNQKIITRCIENGLLTDWFLFAPQCLRIAPPLTITGEALKACCKTIVACID